MSLVKENCHPLDHVRDRPEFSNSPWRYKIEMMTRPTFFLQSRGEGQALPLNY